MDTSTIFQSTCWIFQGMWSSTAHGKIVHIIMEDCKRYLLWVVGSIFANPKVIGLIPLILQWEPDLFLLFEFLYNIKSGYYTNSKTPNNSLNPHCWLIALSSWMLQGHLSFKPSTLKVVYLKLWRFGIREMSHYCGSHESQSITILDKLP